MTAGFNIALPTDRPALRVVERAPEPLTTLATIGINELAAFWNASPECREIALRSADENYKASRVK